MAMFPEGQDPLQPAGAPAMRAPLGTAAPDPFSGPSTSQTIGAALRQNNPIVSVIDGMQQASPDTAYDPNHNPLDVIRGTRYEAEHLSAFTSSPNEATTRAVMAKIDREDQDRQTLAASGWAGTVASVGAGLLDPTMYLPFVGEANALREGVSVGRSAARLATLGALQSTTSELALQSSQQTRTAGESLGSIATNTLLMGIIGAGGGWLSKGEHASAVEGLDAVRRDFSQPVATRSQMAQTGDALIDRVLDSPVTKGVIDNPVINREHDVPYGAGGSVPLADPTVFIDRHFPKEMNVGGITFDPAEPFAVHENIEQHVMGILIKGGMTEAEAYRVAHFQWAERAEGAWYRAHGIDQAAAEAQYKPILDQIQHEAPENPPSNLYTKPYPHDDVHLAQHEGTTEAQPSDAETTRARGIIADWLKENGGLGTPANQNAPQFGVAQAAGAAAADQRELVLKGYHLPENVKALPVIGKALSKAGDVLNGFSPTLRVFASDILPAKRAMADLAETPLVFEDNAKGIPTSLAGAPLDRLIKMQSRQAQMQAADTLHDAFVDYRYGENQPRFPMAQSTFEDLRGQAGGKLSYGDFKSQVSEALWSGDEHAIPQVQQAAQTLRQKVFRPVEEAAQRTLGPDGRPMLGDALEPPKGDKSFFPRSWNKDAIAAKRNQFRETVTNWLAGEQTQKAAAKDRLTNVSQILSDTEGRIKGLSDKIEGRTSALETLENRQEEVQRLNQFAYKRSAKLSQPLDDMREKISAIQAKVQPHLDKLDQLAQDIRAEKENFPEIKEADATIFKMIGAAQKLKQSKDIVDTVENATEYSSRLDEVISGFRGGIREASSQAKLARRDLGADTLVALEKSKADVRKEIKPYLKALNATRKELAAESARKVPGARGGAAFETEIRNRGNTLADRASGKSHELDTLGEQLGREKESAAALRKQIEEELGKWEGKSSAEAKGALKAREEAYAMRAKAQEAGTYKGAGERLTSADSAVDSAVKRILKSDRDLSHEELGNRADEVIDRILGGPDGRLPYDAASGGPVMGPPGQGQQVRGSLNARDFAIPSSMVKDFIEKDTEHAIAGYLRTVLPDVMLTQRFGDVEMSNTFRQVNEAFAAKAAEMTGDRNLSKLEAQRQGMIRDLAATRDRVRGVYGWSPDPRMRNAARIANTFRNWNLIADLGTSVFNRLQDATSTVFRYGFMNVMNDAYRPFLKGMLGMSELPSASRKQAIAMASAVDGMMGHMRHQFGDVLENYRPGSKFERGLAWAADKSMLVNLHGPWTDWTKTMATAAAGAEFLRTAERIAGGSGAAKDIERMAAASIDPHMATRIWNAYSDGGGSKIDGVHVPNTGDWKDASARQAFEAAMGREADIAVITPGAEKPLWMSNPLASLLGQFKSFIAGAHERLLIANLQQRDARTLQGLITVMATGMLSYRLYTWLSGKEVSDRPQDWVKEAISRSAITGWLSEINGMQAKFTSGATDAYRLIGADHPLSRMQSASALSELLGPTYSHLEGLTGAIGDASRGTWNANDTHRIREWAWMQNLFAVRRLLDDAEDGINNAFGIKPKDRSRQAPL